MKIQGHCDICRSDAVGVVPIVVEGIVDSISLRCAAHGGNGEELRKAAAHAVAAYRAQDDRFDGCMADLARALGEEG